MNGPVSRSLWIYIVLTVPLTGLVVLIWWWIDQRMARRFGTRFGGSSLTNGGEHDKEDNHDKGAEEHLNRLEGQILERIRHRTGAQLTWTFTASRSHHSRASRPIARVEAEDVGDYAAAAHPRSKMGRMVGSIARVVPGARNAKPPRDIEL